jgi:hypothetical protein
VRAGLLGLALLASALATHTDAHAQTVSGLIGPADVRSMDLTLDASGNGTWDVTAGGSLPPFAGVPDVTHLAQAVNTNDYLVCNYTTRTTSTIAVHCLRINGLAALLTGLFGGSLAGVKVNLIARYRPGS